MGTTAFYSNKITCHNKTCRARKGDFCTILVKVAQIPGGMSIYPDDPEDCSFYMTEETFQKESLIYFERVRNGGVKDGGTEDVREVDSPV